MIENVKKNSLSLAKRFKNNLRMRTIDSFLVNYYYNVEARKHDVLRIQKDTKRKEIGTLFADKE